MLALLCGYGSGVRVALGQRGGRQCLHWTSKKSSGPTVAKGRLENDPYEVARKVSAFLKKHDYDRALRLVESKARDVSMADKYTVSWNRLIQYNMKTGKMSTAWKVYHEMKRRGQRIDSYTHAHLFLGLQRNVHFKTAAAGALKLWNTLCASMGPLGAETIHGNAMLHIAWKTKDMVTFWDIVNTMSQSKKKCLQPDTATYTIILSVLCDNAIANPNRAEEHVSQGKQIWEEIMKKWAEGSVHMDGKLASTFCQLLLSGQQPNDFDSVFSVIQDVYGIQRIKAPLEHVLPRLTSRIIPLVPETRILKSLLIACRKFRQKNVAQSYWSVFVNFYKVTPDLPATHIMIKLLADTRDSGAALDLIQETQSRGIELAPLTVYLALHACRRSANFEDALQVIALSQKCDIEISAKLMFTLLKVADTTEDEKIYLQALELVASLPMHVLGPDSASMNVLAMVKKLRNSIKRVDFLLFKDGYMKAFFEKNEKMWLRYGSVVDPSEGLTVSMEREAADDVALDNAILENRYAV